MYDKGSKKTQWGKNNLFNNGVHKTGYSQAKERNLTPSYTTHKN